MKRSNVALASLRRAARSKIASRSLRAPCLVAGPVVVLLVACASAAGGCTDPSSDVSTTDTTDAGADASALDDAGAHPGAGDAGAADVVTPPANRFDVAPVFRYSGPQDHLWTTDIRGEGAVAAGYGWEGTTFYIYGKAPSAPAKALFRVRGAIGHVYTTDDVERAGWLAQGYVDEGRVGYLATAAGPGLVPLLSSKRSDGLRFVTVSATEATAAKALGFVPETNAGFVPATGPRPANNPYTVGVYYFGMWSPKAFQSIDGWPFSNPSFYGASRSTDWWLGVRDFHDHNCAAATSITPHFSSYCNADWTFLKPAIGYYDLSDVSTIERHIVQAKQNGIGFFDFYWFWNTFTNREDVNDGLDSFLKARNSNDLDFAIDVCEHGGHLSMSLAQTATTAHLIATKYVTRPNYLRTKSGQPIINICDTKGIWNFTAPTQPGTPPDAPDLATIDAFLGALRTEVHAATGKYPLLTVRADEARYDALITHVEGGNCLLPTGSTSSYATIASNVAPFLSGLARPGKALFSCFMENYDERPRSGVMGDASKAYGMVTDHTPAHFARGLRNVKSWMDARPNDEAAQMLTLYAWNEWHEGGRIEPNARDGALYLNLVSDTFQLPIGTDACRTTGVCAAPP